MPEWKTKEFLSNVNDLNSQKVQVTGSGALINTVQVEMYSL